MKTDYLNIINAYKKSSFWSLVCEAGYQKAIISGSIVFLMIVCLIFILYIQYNMAECIMVSLFIIYTLAALIRIKLLNHRLINIIGEEYRFFLEENKLYWAGVRSMLFCQYLYDYNVEHISDHVIEIIDSRCDMRNTTLLNSFSFTICFGVLTIIANRLIELFFEKNNSILLIIIFVLGIILTFFITNFTTIFKGEEKKKAELKFFLSIYEGFGRNLVCKLEKENKRIKLK